VQDPVNPEEEPTMAESVPRLSASTPYTEIIAALEEYGAVIVEDFLDADLLARFNAELDPEVEATPAGRNLTNPAYVVFFGAHTRHLSGIAGRSRVFAEEILCHPILQAVSDEILLRFSSGYRLNVAHVLDRGPGSEQQYLHRDEDVWAHLPRPHPEVQVASVIALEDFTAENGATRVVPGSHRWPRDRQPQLDELVPAVMPAGAAVVYLGSTLHGGGPNTTESQRRRGMHMSFNLGWLRTEENNFLTVPLDVVRTLPRRAQELLGYKAHDAIEIAGGTTGLVNTRCPMDLLDSGEL
jgi:ectoine hydroxylase-related dioxygenase (phytanoyl-CoA dioxygenase family)